MKRGLSVTILLLVVYLMVQNAECKNNRFVPNTNVHLYYKFLYCKHIIFGMYGIWRILIFQQVILNLNKRILKRTNSIVHMTMHLTMYFISRKKAKYIHATKCNTFLEHYAQSSQRNNLTF